jgi:hypothetical protein
VSSARKWLLFLLAIGASLLVVFVAIWVASGHTSDRKGSSSGYRRPSGTPPEVTFATGVTSGNKEVDTFVRDFIDLCRRGDYEQYRLSCTAYMTPISGERFRTIWEYTRKVVITQITLVPEDVKAMHPAYVVRGVAELDPKAKVTSKDVEVMVQWEKDRWAIAPAPRLEAEPASQPVTDTLPANETPGSVVHQG